MTRACLSARAKSAPRLCACGCGNVILTARKEFIGEHRFRERVVNDETHQTDQTTNETEGTTR